MITKEDIEALRIALSVCDWRYYVLNGAELDTLPDRLERLLAEKERDRYRALEP